jgi:hypothetical protein
LIKVVISSPARANRTDRFAGLPRALSNTTSRKSDLSPLHACVTVFQKQSSIVALPLAVGALDPEKCVKEQLEHTRACRKRFFQKTEGGCAQHSGGLARRHPGEGVAAHQQGN